MWIKICANTSLEDALLAAQLGADAVGFVFAPSPRRISPEHVARITPHLPASVERIGVFPALAAEEILRMAEIAHLDVVQLHGGVSLDLLRRLRSLLPPAIDIIQAVSWTIDPKDLEDSTVSAARSASEVTEQLRALAASGLVTRVLIDSKLGAATGGTGIPFDWTAARTVLSDAGKGLELIVAGGLTPGNVAHAIAELRPRGVDVASGVESSPGRKSPEKLVAFLRNARI